jgi:hypothetical protein
VAGAQAGDGGKALQRCLEHCRVEYRLSVEHAAVVGEPARDADDVVRLVGQPVTGERLGRVIVSALGDVELRAEVQRMPDWFEKHRIIDIAPAALVEELLQGDPQ